MAELSAADASGPAAPEEQGGQEESGTLPEAWGQVRSGAPSAAAAVAADGDGAPEAPEDVRPFFFPLETQSETYSWGHEALMLCVLCGRGCSRLSG